MAGGRKRDGIALHPMGEAARTWSVPAFENRELAKAAASILGDEAMHWAILRQALGDNPVPAAFVG
jgi:hypothetical protein